MVSADFVKKAAIYGAAVSVTGAAFFHHRIQGEQRTPDVLCMHAHSSSPIVVDTATWKSRSERLWAVIGR